MTSVSIAMATFNGAAFLRQQLDSIAAQTTIPDELVITDDGSTDATEQIVSDFAISAPFNVRFSRNSSQLGYARNFEHAILKCRGDIISLSDQDDVWFPEKIETVLRSFDSSSECLVVMNGQILTDAELTPGRHLEENLGPLGLSVDDLAMGAATAIRSDWANILFPIPRNADPRVIGLLSHDFWINHLSVLLGSRVYISRPLQYWRRHSNNVTEHRLHDVRGSSRGYLQTLPARAAPLSEWKLRIAMLDAYASFFRAKSKQIEALVPGRIELGLDQIAKERRAHESRIKFYALPRWRRVPYIAKLLQSGGYRFFSGWRSAATDMFRS